MENNKAKKAILFKIIATLLVVVIIVTTNATVVKAINVYQIEKEKDTVFLNQETDLEEIETKREILGEDIEKREHNQKTFKMNDGSYMISMYPSDVHYEKNGVLVEIDNTLYEGNDKIENKEGPYQVKYAKKSKEENLVSLVKDGYEIKWKMIEQEDNIQVNDELQEKSEKIENKEIQKNETIEMKKTAKEKLQENLDKKISLTKEKNKINDIGATIINPRSKNTLKVKKNKEEKLLEQLIQNKISSEISYQNIMNLVSLKYTNTADGIKESIIIKDKYAIQEKFTFQYEAKNMIMELNEKKQVIVYNKDKSTILFVIEAPYMFDNKWEQSDAIDVTLEQKEDNYVLQIIPSQEWIKAEEREYPITIDPTINTSLDYSQIQDTFIFKGDGGTPNRHKAHIIRVGSNKRLKEAPRGLIKFNLPELKSGDQVIDARLSICNYPDTEEWTPSPNEMQIDVHKMTADWKEEEANWDNTNANYDSHITDYIKYKYNEDNPFTFNYFNITAIAKDWYTNGNNYGIMLKDHIETYNYPQSDSYFVSANTHTAFTQGRPMINLVYRNQTGLEDYMTYHTQEIGRAGVVSTNDYNGNLVLVHPDIMTPGNKFPVGLSHVYNTNNKDIDYGYGKGFNLNLAQQITLEKINEIEYAKYLDEDATEHYFKKEENNVYLDEDGLDLRLTLNNNIFTMNDVQGNSLRFKKLNHKWHLYESENTENQKITIELAASGKITSVMDASGVKISLEYTDGKVTAIKDAINRKIQYFYNDSSNLIQIKYFDGKSSFYQYDYLHLLTQVKNIDGSYFNYDYDRQKVNRVRRFRQYGENGVGGPALNITYENNTTRFTDEKGYSNVYTFNNTGKTISIADFGKEANNVDHAYGKMYEYGISKGYKNKIKLESNLICVREMPNNFVKNPYFDDGLNNWQKIEDSNDAEKISRIDNNNVYETGGECGKKKKLYQRINSGGKKGDVYNFSYWVKSFGLQEDENNGKSVRAVIGLIRNDGTIQKENSYVNTDTSQWQYMSKEIIADNDYQAIMIDLINYNGANQTYWDNIGIFKDEKGTSYQYDRNGNIISTVDKAKQNSTFQYNAEGEIIKSINPKGGNYYYEYDYNHKNRLLRATNEQGQKYKFDYDSHGNVISSQVEETNQAVFPRDGRTYHLKFSSTNKVADVQGESKNDGALIQQWGLEEGYRNKEFKFVKKENDYFQIIANHSNKVMDLSISTGKIQQWSNNNGANQLWKVIDNEDGTVRIINKEKGEDYCLTLEKEDSSNGILLIIAKWEGKTNQKLKLCDIDGDNILMDEVKIESEEIYRIRNKNSNLYLEVSGDSNANSVEISQQEYKAKEKKQLWRVLRLSDNTYKMINLDSKEGKAVDVRSGNNANNTPIQIYSNSENNRAQEWDLQSSGENTRRIKTKIEGEERAISILEDSKNRGAKTILYKVSDNDSQKFYFEKADLMDIESSATYKIKSKKSNKYIGINKTNGISLEQQDGDESDTQKWILKKQNNGYYRILSKSDFSQVMDIENASDKEGANINIHKGTGEKNQNVAQEFEFVPVGDNSYFIKPRLTNGKRCLDVADGSIQTGAKIWSWSINNSAAQQFYLEKIEGAEERKYIQTKGEYSEDGRYLIKQYDQRDKEINYEYDTNRGLLIKDIDPNSVVTTYEYDNNTDELNKKIRKVGEKEYNNSYTYDNDKIKTIKHHDTTYRFEYDAFGNTKEVKVGEQALKTSHYEEQNGNLKEDVYGNQHIVKYQYDRFDRMIKKEKTSGTIEYAYDAKSNVKTITDHSIGITKNYTYDLANRVTKVQGNNNFTFSYEYDSNNNINAISYKKGDTIQEMKYNYDSDNVIHAISFSNSLIKMNYDRLARGVRQEIRNEKGSYQTRYAYQDGEQKNRTTTLLKSLKNGDNEALIYTYDNIGNIETITKGKNLVAQYSYDELNELKRENNKQQGKTITYEYDTGGNIVNRKEYGYTEAAEITTQPTKVIEYIYNNANWKDQLISFDGKEITYDEIGNPLTYDGNTYKWQNGRELAGIQNTEKGFNISYQYTDNGIRSSKTVNGETTKYFLEGDVVIYETKGNDTIQYQYDGNKSLIGFQYNQEQYYYIRNGQNDIIGILDNNLEQVVSYEYDSWGKLVSIKDGQENDVTNDVNHIGNINPYRYKGYRYDKETGLYYLQSRYYNPEWGRFLNADGIISTGQGILSHNMYMYCNNNPVMYSDSNGQALTISGLLLGIIGTAVVAYVLPPFIEAISSLGETLSFSGRTTSITAKTTTNQQKKSNNKNARQHIVYGLVDTKRVVQYVGRTKDEPRTRARHRANPARNGLKFETIKGNLNWYEARVYEQYYIQYYKTLNKGNPMNNQINGLAVKNWSKPEFSDIWEAIKLIPPESETYVGK